MELWHTMGNTFIYVSTVDWEGIYINGELRYENHSIPTHVWLDILRDNRYYLDVETYYVDEEYMADLGNFPSQFSKLPKEVLS